MYHIIHIYNKLFILKVFYVIVQECLDAQVHRCLWEFHEEKRVIIIGVGEA